MSGQKKKILILADWYEPGYLAGGPIQSVKNFVAGMKDRYELFVVTRDRDLGSNVAYPGITAGQWTNRPPGVSVFYTPSLPFSRLKKLIAETNPDFIYLNSLYSLSYSVRPLLLLRRGRIKAKVILSPRGMLRASAVAHKGGKKRPFLRLLRLLRLPERLLFHATDEQERLDIKAHFPAAAGIHLIPNFSPALPATTAPLEKKSDHLRCVFIGRIMDIKNLAYFTALLPEVPGGISVEFSICGAVEDEAYWSQIRKGIDALSPSIRTVYEGPVPHDQVKAVLDRHHLFVLPTRGENFGHAIFESFAAGRPVLISDKTPWRGLQEKSAGWDLSLEDRKAWLAAIVSAAGWNQEQFDRFAAGSLAVAKDFQAGTDLTSAYQQLFS